MSRFFLSFFAWFALFFPLWLAGSVWWGVPVSWLSEAAMSWLFPWVAEVAQQGESLVLVTTLESRNASGQSFVPAPEVNYLIYGYGLPFYCALIMAVRASKPVLKILAGMLLLFPFQAFGVCMDWLKQLFVQNHFEAFQHLAYPQWLLEAIALGYQFGYLILPAIAPVLVWMFFERRFVISHFLSGWIEGAVK